MPTNRVDNVNRTSAASQAPVAVRFNGQPMSFDVPPQIQNGRVLVPMRAIFERLGMQVSWDSATRTATAVGNGVEISLQADAQASRVNGAEVALDAPARIVGGRMLVPLRFVAEASGATVGWDGATRTATIDTTNDQVLLVGMNKGAEYEAQQLGKQAKVTFARDAFEDDKVRVAGQVYDLADAGGARGFAATLGLPDEQCERIAQALLSAGRDARDELAQVAQAWARAEKGGLAPARLVLSGHSVGGGVWGDDNGYLALTALGRLAEAMPRAARQIEDLHISGCYSGGINAMERCRAIFPRVKTIWAYTGSAPGSYVGAVEHQRLWERATRGESTDLSRDLAQGTYKGGNVAVWTAARGYSDGNPPMPIEDARDDVARAEPAFDRALSGELAIADTQSGPVRDYYNTLQRLLQHPDLESAELPALEARRDQTIRLIYYSASVARRFSEHHAEAIGAGYASVGLEAPDFATLGRREALAAIAGLEARVGGDAPEAARALLTLLQQGLRDLDPAVIPASWV